MAQKISQATSAYGIDVSDRFSGQVENPKHRAKYDPKHVNGIARFPRLPAARFPARKIPLIPHGHDASPNDTPHPRGSRTAAGRRTGGTPRNGRTAVSRGRRTIRPRPGSRGRPNAAAIRRHAESRDRPPGRRKDGRHRLYDVDRLYDTLPALSTTTRSTRPGDACAGRPNAMPARSAIRRPSSTRWPCPSWRSGAWRTNGSCATWPPPAGAITPTCTARSTRSTAWISPLLYYGDLFYPHYAEPGRHYLYIEGTMGRDTVGLVLSADTRMSEWVVRDLRAERPGAKRSSWDAPHRSNPPATDCATPRHGQRAPDGARSAAADAG